MNEALKQFSEQLALELKARFGSQETVEFIEKAKTSGDDRTFEVVFSTSDEDRQGDALDQSGWDFKYYLLNPVVLFAHDYSSFPIGVITDIAVEGGKGVARGKFAPEGVNPAADMACALYEEKILRAVSPGYIQHDDNTRELLEVSFCPVPAGRYALSMRQVGKLGVSTRELVTKGFFIEDSPPEEKGASPQAGDRCELEDGTPGELAAGDDGKLTCVPEGDKSKSNETKKGMNELEKNLAVEHGRHGTEVAKAIDEFKALDEFGKAIDGENAAHHENCLKAIDENYELEDQKKSIDEFKSAMEAEHVAHVKCFDKAIEEFKSIEEFTKTISPEMERHEKAQMDLCEKEGARMGEGEEDGKAFLAAAIKVFDVHVVEIGNTGMKGYSIPSLEEFEKLMKLALKAGRAISAKNREAIEKCVKAIEDHHAEHGKSTDEITAALKAIMASGDGGEEPKPEEKSGAAPNPRSSTSGASAELESYLFTQRLVRQVKTASEGALRQLGQKIKEARSSGR